MEAKTFKTNVNSKDLKGWNICCICVFHNSMKALRVILDHGGDPAMRSTYNKNAWDLAKVFVMQIKMSICVLLCICIVVYMFYRWI